MDEEPTFEVLVGAGLPPLLALDDLPRAYAWPSGPTVRANMIASLDGSVVGPDGLSGSLGDEADRAVFAALRAGCDAVVVGAGTARAESYGPPPPDTQLVVVSTRAACPSALEDAENVILATTGRDPVALNEAYERWGRARVWTFPGEVVAPRALRERLESSGRSRILHEGGPRLLTDWIAAGCVDEFCLTRSPQLVGGGAGILRKALALPAAELHILLRWRSTLLGQWTVSRAK